MLQRFTAPRPVRATGTIALVMLLAAPVHAEPPAMLDPQRRRAAHAGLDVRTDLGAHPVRVPVGLRAGNWDATLVLDPMFVFDRQHDLDVLVEWYPGERIGLMAGWRWSVVQVDGGTHHQQRSLVGVTAVGPDFASARIRTSASLEVATLWVKHGGGVGADWISADRNFADAIGLGLFVRIEYRLAL